MLTWADKDKLKLLKKRRDRGKRVAALEEYAELPVYLQAFYQAFNLLSRQRPYGLGPNAIPISEMLAYLDLIGVTDIDQRMEYVFYIGELDAEWLSLHRSHKSKNSHPAREGRKNAGSPSSN